MKKGFTLLETLVAIAILLIAVVGPMSIIGGSLSQISTVRDQTIAVNLAQEGIEVVRQKRDSNMLACWGSFILPCNTWGTGLGEGSYIINPLTAVLTVCSGCDTGIYLDVNNFYTQGSGVTATKFSRTVNITDIPSSAEKIITSTVTWSVGGATKTIQVQESIFGINS